jgi:predicted methyltransferase
LVEDPFVPAQSATRQARFYIAVILLGLAFFYAGTHLVVTRQAAARPVHPLTGRQIAGIATDAVWMDRPGREEEEAPDQAVRIIGVRPGMVVADVGAGSGYMTTRLARLVGVEGKVYANDIQPNLLRLIAQKAQREAMSNIEVVQGTDTDTRLPTATIDLVLLVDVYHEFWHPQAMLQSIRRALKPAGNLVVIEYRKEDPSIPIAYTHRMSVAEVRTEVQAEGFTLDRTVEELPRQHILIFRKAGL